MPEYVYALHDFQPENEDEVSFRAGERIEVVEKDDLYGDGWWQGKNLSGQVGLFPKSYTAPAPPPSADESGLGLSTTEPEAPVSPVSPNDDSKQQALHTLAEETEPESPPNQNTNIIAPKPQFPAAFMNGNYPSDFQHEMTHKRTTSGEVMEATMTDVQEAIEQLGRGRGANGDDRSFSFASSIGDHTDRETDTDMSDADGADGAGEGWHKGARAKLAAKAKKAVEEAERLEAMMGRREIAPPIEAELSDESEPEDGEFTMHHSRILGRRHSHIPEESEGEETDQEIRNRLKQASIDSGNSITQPSAGADSTLVDLPERDETDAPTATKASFPIAEPASTLTPEDTNTPDTKTPAPSTPPRAREESIRSFPTPVANTPAPAAKPASPPPPVKQLEIRPVVYRESLIALPSPSGSFPGIALTNEPASPPAHQKNFNKYASMMSNYSMASAASEAPPPVPSLPPSTQNLSLVDDKEKDKTGGKTHPSEWTVDEVIEWLKSKGFDQDVCDKFTEQEITGDVLLELDVNMLKTEIGIMAFGKRMRIANAITDLRRPPSVVYPDTPEQFSPINPHHQVAHNSLTPSQSVSMTHSRSVSQSQSHHSFPGTYSYTQSVRSSMGSPLYAGNGFPVASPLQESPAVEYVVSEAPSTERGHPEYVMPSPQNLSTNGKQLLRPNQLALSPSDSALKVTAQAVSNIPEESEDDPRGHMSDGEIPRGIRKRIFRRSVDSKADSATNSHHSKDGGPPTPDKEAKEEKRTPRNKKSVDGKGGERLSIFGGISGSLSKGRKPAPKYASSANDETSSERSSMFGRYTNRKSSSSALPSGDSNGTVKGKDNSRTRDSAPAAPQSHKDMSEKDHTVLRKRTNSTPADPPAYEANGALSPLKPGQSILEQIGEPDYSGWMRKRGERYNSWKLRYFVLKGHHLYCLKSNSTSETKIKGYVNIVGYKVTVDENLNPGKYGFRIDHDSDKTHYFSSDEKNTVREWMKAIMKATIGRDYSKPVISSCNIPTIPLVVAQTMNPAPRPPSPGAREATQRALRRENPNQLSSRDARILMGLSTSNDGNAEQQALESPWSPQEPKSPVPPRPSRESRRMSVSRTISSGGDDGALIEWANTHLPESLQIVDTGNSPCGGLELLRIAESIKGKPSSPPVPDSLFPRGPSDDKLEGLFRLFDFLLDNDVKMGSVSINDVRQGKRDKIIQLLKALKAWEDKRKAIAQSIGGASSVQAAGFMAPVWG